MTHRYKAKVGQDGFCMVKQGGYICGYSPDHPIHRPELPIPGSTIEPITKQQAALVAVAEIGRIAHVDGPRYLLDTMLKLVETYIREHG